MRRRKTVHCLVAIGGLVLTGTAGAQQRTEGPQSTAAVTGLGDCCVPFNGSPGCNNAVCEAVVCASPDNDVCCTQDWDDICADTAADMCSTLCISSTNECCVSRLAVGCGNAACEAIICGIDPPCCDSKWDSICVAEAAALCGDLCVIEGDCAIDFVLTLDDYAMLADCVTGPGVEPLDDDCPCTDLEGDGDVDAIDWSRLQVILSP